MTLAVFNNSPTPGVIQPTDDFVLEVRTDSTFVLVLFAVLYPGYGVSELVYAGAAGDGDALGVAYAGSIADVTDAGYVRRRFTFRRVLVWPGSPTVRLEAVDAAGAALSATFVYTLPEAASATAIAPTAQPLALVGGSSWTCTAVQYTQDDLLRVLDRAYSAEYLDAIKAKADGGYEQFQAAAQVLARMSLAVARLECDSFLGSASGGVKATGTVEFYRESAADGAIDVAAGSVVTTEDRRDFVTLETASFGVTDLGPHAVAVEAVAVGYEYNVPGQVTTAGGEVLAGEISTIYRLKTATPTIDRNLRVRQLVATSGGRAAALDGLAYDLGVPRITGEDDDEYRLRILETPDTVSPDAIRRGLERLLAAYGGWELREVGTFPFPGMFYGAGSSADVPQDPQRNFAWGVDPTLRPEDAWKCWLSFAEMRAFFMVGIPRMQLGDLGLFYGGSTSDPYPILNPWGGAETDPVRAPNPWDVGQTLQSVVYKAVWELIDAKRAAGVGFDFYLIDPKTSSGTSSVAYYLSLATLPGTIYAETAYLFSGYASLEGATVVVYAGTTAIASGVVSGGAWSASGAIPASMVGTTVTITAAMGSTVTAGQDVYVGEFVLLDPLPAVIYTDTLVSITGTCAPGGAGVLRVNGIVFATFEGTSTFTARARPTMAMASAGVVTVEATIGGASSAGTVRCYDPSLDGCTVFGPYRTDLAMSLVGGAQTNWGLVAAMGGFGPIASNSTVFLLPCGMLGFFSANGGLEDAAYAYGGAPYAWASRVTFFRAYGADRQPIVHGATAQHRRVADDTMAVNGGGGGVTFVMSGGSLTNVQKTLLVELDTSETRLFEDGYGAQTGAAAGTTGYTGLKLGLRVAGTDAIREGIFTAIHIPSILGASARADIQAWLNARPKIKQTMDTISENIEGGGGMQLAGGTRGVMTGGYYFIPYLQESGNCRVAKVDVTTNAVSAVVTTMVTHSDDHSSPDIALLPDGTMIVCASQHNGPNIQYLSVSAALALGTLYAATFASGLGVSAYTYPRWHVLATRDEVWLTFRGDVAGLGRPPTLVVLTLNSGSLPPDFSPGGGYWSAAVHILSGLSTVPALQRPYAAYGDDGLTKLFMAYSSHLYTDGDPPPLTGQSLYWIECDNGTWQDADASPLGTLPINYQNGSLIASGLEYMFPDAVQVTAGVRRVLFTRHMVSLGLPWEICEARYIGGTWRIVVVCTNAVSHTEGFTSENNSRAGARYDPNDPDIVVAAVDKDGVIQIVRLKTSDGGLTWVEHDVTVGSSGEISGRHWLRPYALPDGRVLGVEVTGYGHGYTGPIDPPFSTGWMSTLRIETVAHHATSP